MSRDRARRFAQILFDEYCHEGTFDVVLPAIDLSIVEDVFRTEFKCQTRVDVKAERLTVHCPNDPQ